MKTTLLMLILKPKEEVQTYREVLQMCMLTKDHARTLEKSGPLQTKGRGLRRKHLGSRLNLELVTFSLVGKSISVV